MLHLSTKTGSNIWEARALSASIYGSEASKVELADRNLAAELKPCCLFHNLAEEKIWVDAFISRFLDKNGAEFLN